LQIQVSELSKRLSSLTKLIDANTNLGNISSLDMSRMSALISDKLDEKIKCFVDKKHFESRICDLENQLRHVMASIPLPVKSGDFVTSLDLEDHKSLIKKDLKKLEDTLRNNVTNVGDDHDVKLNNIRKTFESKFSQLEFHLTGNLQNFGK